VVVESPSALEAAEEEDSPATATATATVTATAEVVASCPICLEDMLPGSRVKEVSWPFFSCLGPG